MPHQPASRSPDAVAQPLAVFLGAGAHAQAVRHFSLRVGPQPRRVLLVGETGTGKRVVATLLHAASGRAGPLVRASAGEIAPSLLHDVLFGHAAGAFTGAVRSHHGLLECAHGGTIVFDEVQDFPPPLQQALLAFLDEGACTALGAERSIRVDVRVVSATQRPPAADAALPADLTAETLDLLERHPWPGNVRELENVVRAAAWDAAGEPAIRPHHLPEWFFEERESGRGAAGDLDACLATVVRDAGGNLTAAARRLHICTKTVRRHATRIGLELRSPRAGLRGAG